MSHLRGFVIDFAKHDPPCVKSFRKNDGFVYKLASDQPCAVNEQFLLLISAVTQRSINDGDPANALGFIMFSRLREAKLGIEMFTNHIFGLRHEAHRCYCALIIGCCLEVSRKAWNNATDGRALNVSPAIAEEGSYWQIAVNDYVIFGYRDNGVPTNIEGCRAKAKVIIVRYPHFSPISGIAFPDLGNAERGQPVPGAFPMSKKTFKHADRNQMAINTHWSAPNMPTIDLASRLHGIAPRLLKVATGGRRG